MSNRYAAVVRTYPQRLFSSWLPALMVIFLAFMTVTPFLHRHTLRSGTFDFTHLFPAAYVVGTIALHLKQLTIDAKGRLLPRSMWPVLVVTGACAVTYLVGLPLLMSACGRPLLWSAALVWIWCAAVFHFVIRPSWAIGIVLALAYVGLIHASSPGNAWSADHSSIDWLLLLASVVWFAIITRWLLHMDEESRGYKAMQSGQKAWKARETSIEQTNQPWQDPRFSWALRFNSPGQHQMDRFVRYSGSASIFIRCRRWQVGEMQQYAPCVFAVAVVAPQIFMPNPALFLVMLMSFGFAITMPTVQRLQQWRTLANGLLKPIRREDYLREMGLCLAIDMVRNLAVLFVLILGVTLLGSPNDSRPALVLPVLLLTALAATFCFGAIVWLMRSRSALAIAVPTFVLIVPYAMLALISRIPSMRWIAPCTAALLALIGLWLARDAYRRWLLTDLG